MFHKEFAVFRMRRNIIYKVSSLSFYAFLINIFAGEIGLEVEGSEKRVRGKSSVPLAFIEHVFAMCRLCGRY